MARDKKVNAAVTLFARIEAKQHEALRKIAFDEHRSIADLVREALDQYVGTRRQRQARVRAT